MQVYCFPKGETEKEKLIKFMLYITNAKLRVSKDTAVCALHQLSGYLKI